MSNNSHATEMNNDLVSVVVPTFNYGRYVTQAVESVLSQTYLHFEVIVVDDGSTDDTRERLEPYRGRIHYVYQKNGGISSARNTGIEASRGRLIALLDSDDLWHPRKLEIQVDYLRQHPEIALLGSTAIKDMQFGWPAPAQVNENTGKAIALSELVIRSYFAPSSIIIRRECFQKVGLFDTSLRAVEDRDMWIRVASRYLVANLQMPLIYYRLHDGNMSLEAARMEVYESKVLRKVFTEIQPLRRSFLLRQKAFSYAKFSAAFMYGASGAPLRSLTRMLHSFLLWPLPYRRGEVRTSLMRPRTLMVLLLRMLGLKEKETKGSQQALQSAAMK
jgi:glycosyltransferase involved in cell wall biosynthesis